MTNTIDPVSHWIRQLADIRAQAAKRRRIDPSSDLTESALSICDAVVRDLAGARLECDRLRAEIRAADAAWEHLFDAMPGACLLTDGAGFILSANRAVGTLLNLSAKHLKDRELVVFSEERGAFQAILQRLGRSGDDIRETLTFRPRERKPAAVQVVVKPLTSRPGLWLWFLTPVGHPQTATRAHIASGGESWIPAS